LFNEITVVFIIPSFGAEKCKLLRSQVVKQKRKISVTAKVCAHVTTPREGALILKKKHISAASCRESNGISRLEGAIDAVQ
jgi:hypothetical protein